MQIKGEHIRTLQSTYPQTSPYLLHSSLKSNSSVCTGAKNKAHTPPYKDCAIIDSGKVSSIFDAINYYSCVVCVCEQNVWQGKYDRYNEGSELHNINEVSNIPNETN